jgi:chromosome segregation ATPase
MRDDVKEIPCDGQFGGRTRCALEHILSSSAGKDYVHKSEVERKQDSHHKTLFTMTAENQGLSSEVERAQKEHSMRGRRILELENECERLRKLVVGWRKTLGIHRSELEAAQRSAKAWREKAMRMQEYGREMMEQYSKLSGDFTPKEVHLMSAAHEVFGSGLMDEI